MKDNFLMEIDKVSEHISGLTTAITKASGKLTR